MILEVLAWVLRGGGRQWSTVAVVGAGFEGAGNFRGLDCTMAQ